MQVIYKLKDELNLMEASRQSCNQYPFVCPSLKDCSDPMNGAVWATDPLGLMFLTEYPVGVGTFDTLTTVSILLCALRDA